MLKAAGSLCLDLTGSTPANPAGPTDRVGLNQSPVTAHPTGLIRTFQQAYWTMTLQPRSPSCPSPPPA